MKKFYTFLFTFTFCLLISNPAFALTFTEIDNDGNERVIIDVENYTVDASQPMPVSDLLPPHPQQVALLQPQLSGLALDMPIPGCASVIVFDFGPNWKSVIDDLGGNYHGIHGRYVYLFTGQYDSFYGKVANGMGRGEDKFKYTESDKTLEVAGPYAVISWNEEDNQLYSDVNYYPASLVINAYRLEMSDVVTTQGVYPRAMCFADDTVSMIPFGSSNLSTKVNYLSWNEDYNGTLDDSEEDNTETNDFWDFITNGWFESSDNPVVQAFTRVLKGLADVVLLVENIELIFAGMFSFLPSEFLNFIKICIAMLVTAVLIKFAMHVLR